jgi:amidase
MVDPTLRSARDLLRALHEGALTSRALLDAYLDRIDRHDGPIHAVVTRDDAAARAAADAADAARARGDVRGPLHGLPMTVKDTLETAGMRTTAGFAPLAEHVPEADAESVARLRGAGAIVFGKTNTPILAGDWQTTNPVFGRTSNPWDPTRSPGGSSGGSAAAVAAGFTPLELGSDIGGSIRVPASWCGVYGHKPTHGIIPLRGHIPGPPGTLSEADLGVVGPLARTAEDLVLALDVLAGPSPEHAVGWRLALPPPRRKRLQDYRIAAWLEDAEFPVDDGVRGVLEAAIDALRRAGVRVDDRARPGFGLGAVRETYAALVWPILMAGVPAETLDDLAGTHASGTFHGGAWLAQHARGLHRTWLAANESRARYRAAFRAFFAEWDALLMPVTAVPAIPHDDTDPMWRRTIRVNGTTRPYFDLFAWIAPATACLHPATAAPVGRTADGLPVGVQIVGPYLEDRTTLDVAGRLAEVVGGFVPPPGF